MFQNDYEILHNICNRSAIFIISFIILNWYIHIDFHTKSLNDINVLYILITSILCQVPLVF